MYFSMRRVMLNRQSLETLADIAEHPTLGPSVREVEVSINYLLPLDELHTLEPPSVRAKPSVHCETEGEEGGFGLVNLNDAVEYNFTASSRE
jgi:hypothetical protein